MMSNKVTGEGRGENLIRIVRGSGISALEVEIRVEIERGKEKGGGENVKMRMKILMRIILILIVSLLLMKMERVKRKEINKVPSKNLINQNRNMSTFMDGY